MKGIATFWVQTFFGLMIILLVLALYYFFVIERLTVHVILQNAELDRRAMNFAQLLLNDENLVYFDGEAMHRGLFEVSKLTTNLPQLDTKIGYPDDYVKVTITDVENSRAWTKDFGSAIRLRTAAMSPTRIFPVAIRYSVSEIHAGLLSVKLVD